jgi:hypothetical protein
MRGSARERYLKDPLFSALVASFLHIFETQCGTGAGVTPSEIREASGYAWQLYHERRVDPIWLHDPRQDGM